MQVNDAGRGWLAMTIEPARADFPGLKINDKGRAAVGQQISGLDDHALRATQ